MGGIGGALLGERLPENFRERMPLIFGCCALGLGIALIGRVSFLPVPVLALLFFSAALIMPLTTPEIIGDFSAVGGLLLLGAGFRLCRLVSFPLANMLPSLLIAMPISAVWVRFFSV
jgi:uncharacterized membrane protein YqgA involved in biofilm formation